METDDLPCVPPLWRITLFGGLTVTARGPIVDRFEHRKAASLLACLAFSPHRIHSREQLMEMLWPDENPEATRVRFRQVLLKLRHALDATGAPSQEFLTPDRASIRLHSDRISTDVAEYEAALARAARQPSASLRAATLQHAVRIFTGPLLPGFYEDWVENERRRLAESYLNALGHLAAALGEIGDLDGAMEATRRALAIDPLREEAHCDLIRLLASAGRTTESLRQYQELKHALWTDLQTTPSPAAEALLEEVRSLGTTVGPRPASAAPPPRTPSPPIPTPVSTESPALPAQPAVRNERSRSVLPAPLTPLFGRSTEIAWLTERLRPQRVGETRTSRLVTLTGLGGSGKTRLALEAARLLSPLYPGALWFVPVVEVTEAEHLIGAIAEAVCGSGVERDALLDRLRQQPTLVVLDNFEQIEVEGATTIRRLLEQAPGLTCLVTSRRRLDIGGEVEFAVSPLSTPTASDSSETLSHCPSIQLFLDHAQRALPGFRLTEANREALARLCTHLEGIPLAIELAAAWCAVLSPAQLLERYAQDFAVLVSSRPDIPLRHRSLSAAIESSFQALESPLQALFEQLSVFQGGWTLAAAEAVCDDAEALSHLAALRRCSLIIAEERDGEMRFRMLETLRAFARRRLDTAATEALRRRHAEYFVTLAERAAPCLTGPDQIDWLHRLQADYDNLRAALDCTAQAETPRNEALRLGIALSPFWDVRRHYPEVGIWIRRVPDLIAGADPPLQARALEAAGTLAANLHERPGAWEMMQRSLALYREQEDAWGAARSLCTLAVIARENGELRAARAMMEEALPILEGVNDPFYLGRALGGLGTIARAQGYHAEAEALVERAATLYRLCGHKKGAAWCLCTLGSITEARSLEVACARFEEGLQMARTLENQELIIFALYNLAYLAEIQGELEQAIQRLEEGAAVVRPTGDALMEAVMAVWHGDLAAEIGRDAEACRCYLEALRVSQRANLMPNFVSALRSVALYEASRGRPISAIRLAAVADREGGSELAVPAEHHARRRLNPAALRDAVGEAAFTVEWRLGETLSLEQAGDYAVGLLAAALSESTAPQPERPPKRVPSPRYRTVRRV